MCKISGSHCGSQGTLKMDVPNHSKMFAHIHHMAQLHFSEGRNLGTDQHETLKYREFRFDDNPRRVNIQQK